MNKMTILAVMLVIATLAANARPGMANDEKETIAWVATHSAKECAMDNDSDAAAVRYLQQEFKMINGNSYIPRDVNLGGLDYEFFLYFKTDSTGHEPQLRLYIQYCADDPLHYYEILFFIDCQEYLFKPCKPKLTTLKGRYYLETSDTEVTVADKQLIDALMDNHGIVLKFKGAGGMGHVIPLTDRQCQGFINSIEFYRRMGGKL